MKFKNSKIYRAGVTAKNLQLETNECDYFVFPNGEIELRFKINSKGGGKTKIHIAISKEDFAEMLTPVLKYNTELLAKYANAIEKASQHILK